MIYIYLHIPRTGGTFIETAFFDCFSRENDECYKHYWYVDGGWSDRLYEQRKVPRLVYRTKAQQQKIKLITGHSVYANSNSWLKFHTEKRIFTTVRHPIERLLSSFNYRHMLHTLLQDPNQFSNTNPPLLNSAVAHSKVAADYDSLYEFYLDNPWEHNLQCKWIIKSFLDYKDNQWYYWKPWSLGADQKNYNNTFEVVSQTWPNWMGIEFKEDVNLYDMVSNLQKEIWWIGVTENLDKDAEDFSKLLETGVKQVADKNKSNIVQPYWTMEEVMRQPDIQKLIKAEEHDFKLYEYAKRKARPF